MLFTQNLGWDVSRQQACLHRTSKSDDVDHVYRLEYWEINAIELFSLIILCPRNPASTLKGDNRLKPMMWSREVVSMTAYKQRRFCKATINKGPKRNVDTGKCRASMDKEDTNFRKTNTTSGRQERCDQQQPMKKTTTTSTKTFCNVIDKPFTRSTLQNLAVVSS